MHRQEIKKIGNYQIIRSLGKGELSQVYSAYDEVAKREVALKLLLPELARDPLAMKRLEHEALSATKIRHKNMVRIYAVERTPEGHPYIVMELIDGPSLAEVIKRKIEYPTIDLIEFMIQAAEGLRAALLQKLIHCDVKPMNMIISPAKELKLVDFGLAKAVWTPTQPQQPGLVAGTPQYMSPEQVEGRPLDHRSDIYSLGASFYHIISGRPPFEGSTARETMVMHSRVPLVPLRKWRPDICEELSEIIDHTMAKLPEDRYQDYDDLIGDLNEGGMAQISLEKKEKEEPEASEAAPRLQAGPSPYYKVSETTMDSQTASRVFETMKLEESKQQRTHWGRKLIALLAFILFLTGALWLMSITVFNPLQPGKPPKSPFRAILKNLQGEKEKVPYKLRKDEIFAVNLKTYRRMVAIYHKREIFEFDKGYSLRSLDELVKDDYLEPGDIKDAWGKPFGYVVNTGKLSSAGLNGIKGTRDDFVLNRAGVFEKMPEEFRLKAMETDLKISDKIE